jgi:predicted nucleic acid-binding protein
MSSEVFVDTNVLVYDQDASERSKQPIANRWISHLWQTRRGRLSTQVLSEYYVTVTRKLKPRRPTELARADVRDLTAWRPVPLDKVVIDGAWALEERYSLSWWDALVVSAAQVARTTFLLTEDLQDGQVFGELRVVNPFVHDINVIG